MQIAFRVDLDCESDPTLLKSQDWRIGDKFVLKGYNADDYGYPTEPAVRTVRAILSQYVPNVPYPAVRPCDMYLIADGLVISSDKVIKVE